MTQCYALRPILDLVGSDRYLYDTDRYLITSVHMPALSRVAEASAQRPYLGLRYVVDQQQLSLLAADNQLPQPRSPKTAPGILTGAIGQRGVKVPQFGWGKSNGDRTTLTPLPTR